MGGKRCEHNLCLIMCCHDPCRLRRDAAAQCTARAAGRSGRALGARGVRIWGDAPAAQIRAMVDREMRQRGEVAIARSKNRAGVEHARDLGGAEDGAFGAGMLTGWTAAGTRPEFDFVTGVSAGALIAPFAFLGSRRTGTKAFLPAMGGTTFDGRPASGIFGGPALADSAPLARLIAHYVDERLPARDSARTRKGRILLIGTTNLDAQRSILWDMGRIAMSDNPQALSLFRQILLASASVPALFPPVRIQVYAEWPPL